MISLLHPEQWLSDEMGEAGSHAAEHSSDRPRASGKFHRGIGWEEFTDAAIKILNEQDRPMVFILWGRPAQAKKSMLNNPKHLILEAPHPSPLSAYRGFFGSRPFSKTNEFLKEHGVAPIDWQIENV